MFYLTPGLGKRFKLGITNRLELINSVKVNTTNLKNFKSIHRVEIINFLNYYYSQVNSVNNVLYEVKKLNVIRFYLIKSYRGKCHSIGKPVNGQRTWSNAWSSYNNNFILRRFISEAKSKLLKDKVPEKINYKLTKKKYITKRKKVKQIQQKKLIWF